MASNATAAAPPPTAAAAAGADRPLFAHPAAATDSGQTIGMAVAAAAAAHAQPQPDDEERKESDVDGVPRRFDEAMLSLPLPLPHQPSARPLMPAAAAPLPASPLSPVPARSSAPTADAALAVPSCPLAAADAAAHPTASSHPAPFGHFPREYIDAATRTLRYPIRLGHVLIYSCLGVFGYSLGVVIGADQDAVSNQ